MSPPPTPTGSAGSLIIFLKESYSKVISNGSQAFSLLVRSLPWGVVSTCPVFPHEGPDLGFLPTLTCLVFSATISGFYSVLILKTREVWAKR